MKSGMLDNIEPLLFSFHNLKSILLLICRLFFSNVWQRVSKHIAFSTVMVISLRLVKSNYKSVGFSSFKASFSHNAHKSSELCLKINTIFLEIKVFLLTVLLNLLFLTQICYSSLARMKLKRSTV